MSALSPRQMFLLDSACYPIRQAFCTERMSGLYLVGSAMNGDKSNGTRDIDVRCMLNDERYEALVGVIGIDALRFVGLAIAQYLASVTGLPIDFQFQQTSAANAKHGSKEVVRHAHDVPLIGCRCADNPANVQRVGGMRNPIGMRELGHYAGDAEPD